MKVILIRHGMTPGNIEKRYLGRTDEGLSTQGIEEIKARVQQKQYPKVDYLLLSPMKRCQETAKLIYPELLSTGHYLIKENLKEMDFGKFEYKNYLELSEEEEYQHYIDCGGMTAFPEGEEPEAFCDRCVEAFCEGMNAIKEKVSVDAVIGVVVHGGTIRALMYRLCTEKRTYHEWMLANADFYRCDYRAEEMSIIYNGR